MAPVDAQKKINQTSGISLKGNAMLLSGDIEPWDEYISVPLNSRYFQSNGDVYQKIDGADDTEAGWSIISQSSDIRTYTSIVGDNTYQSVDSFLASAGYYIMWRILIQKESDRTKRQSMIIECLHDWTHDSDIVQDSCGSRDHRTINGGIQGMVWQVVYTGTGHDQQVNLQFRSNIDLRITVFRQVLGDINHGH